MTPIAPGPTGPLPPLAPVTLEGSVVRLEPLALRHVPDLCTIGLDPELWRWIPVRVNDADGMRAYVEDALAQQQAGTALPFAIIHRASGRVAGCTRYGNIDRAHRRLEIGWTWLGKAFQRTAANTEAKFLLLNHAFETLGFNRVEFKTDALNAKSRAALARIGAKEEGTLRSHIVTDTGRIRDSVYFSVIIAEWASVRAALQAKLSPR